MMMRLSEILYRFRVPALTFFVLCSMAYIYSFKPDSTTAYPGCPFKFFTGFYCPGCGSLRATHYLLHGDFLAAIDMNVLTVLLLPFIIYSYFNFSIKAVMKRPHSVVFIKAQYIWLLLSVILFFGVIRNFHIFPFNYLAP